MHRDYLRQHKKAQFNIMLAKGTLWTYLSDVDRQATETYDLLIEQMKDKEGVTEQLKEQDQMVWVARMSNIEARAREIICNELICT